jgi:hypothetical protein
MSTIGLLVAYDLRNSVDGRRDHQVMFVPLDASRAYRFSNELVELVETIVRADPNNEST